MLAGQLRDLITVYSEIRNTNSKNARLLTYVKAFDDRANVKFISGDKQFSINTEITGKTNIFMVRFALGRYVETMVIGWRGDYYLINSIDADPARTYLYITAAREIPGSVKIVEGE